MIVVIQWAAKKRPDAGHLRTTDGHKVLFVADPAKAPPSNSLRYARPDDASDAGGTWRDVLVEQNRQPEANPLRLCRAIDLYVNPAYQQIAQRFGAERAFILSAGWGLVRGDFLLPDYDITFSMMADAYKRRKKTDPYRDFAMLPAGEPVVFFGSKDYVPLFEQLTRTTSERRTVFYNSDSPPIAPGCTLVRFPTTTRTNWHYECVGAFLRGDIEAA
jgi:hypothetical protein